MKPKNLGDVAVGGKGMGCQCGFAANGVTLWPQRKGQLDNRVTHGPTSVRAVKRPDACDDAEGAQSRRASDRLAGAQRSRQRATSPVVLLTGMASSSVVAWIGRLRA